MKRALALLALLVLAGCDTIPRTVKVPLPVYCKVEKPAEPAWATKQLAPGADLLEKVKALLAERRQRIFYEAQLSAAIEACQPPAP